MNVDPNGTFFLTALIVGSIVGAGIGFGTTVYKDYKDDGKIFNGSVGWRQYLGNSLGGAIAGAGVGFSGALGLSAGISLLSSSSIVIGGLSVSVGTAFVLGTGVSFISGGLGYLLSVGIDDKKSFNMEEFLAESIVNTVKGAYSFIGGFLGGSLGLKGFKGNSFKNNVKYHGLLTVTGIYPSKMKISFVKKIFEKR